MHWRRREPTIPESEPSVIRNRWLHRHRREAQPSSASAQRRTHARALVLACATQLTREPPRCFHPVPVAAANWQEENGCLKQFLVSFLFKTVGQLCFFFVAWLPFAHCLEDSNLLKVCASFPLLHPDPYEFRSEVSAL